MQTESGWRISWVARTYLPTDLPTLYKRFHYLRHAGWVFDDGLAEGRCLWRLCIGVSDGIVSMDMGMDMGMALAILAESCSQSR